jgi:outer membrane protein assembly factor BamB
MTRRRRPGRLSMLLALASTLALAGCGSATTSPKVSPAATGASPASGTTSAEAPAIADVLTYRGGNTRTAVMPGPGPTEAPVELWHHDTSSGCTAEPVVVGGRVIAVSDHGQVTALDAVTGAESATHDLAAGVAELSNPAADGNTLFVVTEDGVLHALSITTWTERWHEAGYEPGTQVAVDGGFVLAGAPGMLVARNVGDGAEAWSVAVAEATRIAVGPGRAYVSGPLSGVLTEIDLGRHIATHKMQTGGADVLTPAAVDGGVIAGFRGAPGGPNGVVAYDGQGNLRWRWVEPGGYRLDAVEVDGDTMFVYVGDPGVVDVVDPATGRQRGQPHRLAGPGDVLPAVADGLLYLVGPGTGLSTMDGEGRIVWEVPFDGATGPARLVVTGGLVIVPMTIPGSGGRIVAFVAPSDPRASGRPSEASATATASTAGTPGVQVVKVYDTSTGAFVQAPAQAPLVINQPALAPDGTFYALDQLNDRVLAMKPDGTVTWWGSKGSGMGQLDFQMVTGDAPLGIAVSPDGQLIAVGEGGNHRVQLFDPTGRSLRTIGRLGRGDGQFVDPAGVAVDSEHRIWVADPGRDDIQVFDEQGVRLFGFGSAGSGPGQLERVSSPFVDEASGKVLIPDFGNRRIAIFSEAGDFVRNIVDDPASGLFFEEVNQIAVDPWGRLFVLDKGVIYILDPGGHLVATIPLTFDGIGTLDPWGMALDAKAGRLLIADPSPDHHLIVAIQLSAPLWPAAVSSPSP